MITDESKNKAGGDWTNGYGEVTGEAFLELIRQGKISFFFGDTHLLVGVEKPNGESGTYNLEHKPFP